MLYFEQGEIIAESGDVKVYDFEGDHYLEIGPGHNLWAISNEILEYKDQLGDKPRGGCLEIGLGLGVASKYILSQPSVKSLITVEKNDDVIDTYRQLNSSPHTVINMVGLDFILATTKTFDFIFLDFYGAIDEDTLEELQIYIKTSKKILNDGGEIMGWFDIYTPEDAANEFFNLFKGDYNEKT